MKKTKGKITSLFLSLTVLLSSVGCSFRNNSHNNTKTDNTPRIDSLENVSTDNLKRENKDTNNFEEKNVTPSEVEKNKEEIIETKEELNFSTIELEYPFSDFYYTPSEISDFITNSIPTYTCPNTNTNYKDLFEIIKNNSYTLDESLSFFSYEGLSLEQQSENIIIENCLKEALDRCFKNATNNIAEDICALGNLRIVKSEPREAFVFASYDDYTKTISINYYYMLLEYSKNSNQYESFEEMLIWVLTHELNHARQFVCEHREKEQISSIADGGMPSELESSAESAQYNLNPELQSTTNTNSYTYKDGRTLESRLLLISAFNENRTINDYYNAIFDTDISSLYTFFNLTSESDYESFYNILYAMNTLDGYTELYNRTITIPGFNYDLLLTTVGPNYKIDIMKLSLRNLIASIKNNSLSLEESLTLYYLIKGQVMHIDYKTEYFIDYHESELLQSVNEIEEEFYLFLTEFYERDLETIRTLNADLIPRNYENLLDSLFDPTKLSPSNSSLLERFPITKNILWTNPILNEEIEQANNHLENEKNKLELKPKAS